ncbi:ABC transporter ATP-binding protein [Blautia parvula]|uniref:ABC transporter ATP-binding protein n=1 Tax=Blautia parvula TaxID=2877527 RepID=UPI0036F2D10C
MDCENSIKIMEITQRFGDKTVLEDISLTLKKGEIFGLLGPSGAGKTTLIKILTGQLVQTGGRAEVLGTDTRKLTSSIYTKMGMVLDNTGLYERLSCRDNLALFAEIYRIPKAKIREILSAVGLLEAEKRPVSKLSKGMRQRLVMARALMHSPEILFLDEPGSALDPSTVSEIHNLIRQEQAKGATVFLTTHNMEEAEKLCDHVALLNQGKIVEYGKPEEICRKYNEQNRVRILLKDGREIDFRNSRESAGKIQELFASEQVESIHSTEPNLETVFLELTGRRFE